MKRFVTVILILIFGITQINAQTKEVKGKVFAFKDLPLNNIKITAKKTGNKTFSDSNGIFTIDCKKNDKLIFTGKGFYREVHYVKEKNQVYAKLIFKGGSKNIDLAVNNDHTNREQLENSLANFDSYNNYMAGQTNTYFLIHQSSHNKNPESLRSFYSKDYTVVTHLSDEINNPLSGRFSW